MTSNAIATTLTVLGAAFEIGGLVVVVLEIRSDQKAAAALFAPPKVDLPPERHFPVAPSAASFEPSSLMSYGGDIQARDVQRHLTRELAGVTKLVLGAHEAAVTHTDRVGHALGEGQREMILAVRSDLNKVLTGNTRNRAIGAAMLFVGILLSGAGSIVSTRTFRFSAKRSARTSWSGASD